MIKGRAETFQEKKTIIKRLLKSWENNSNLRLGQLIVDSIKSDGMKRDLFYMEDDELIILIEKLIRRYK